MRITIENLPPIASGSFDLRPLTLFIGPNNTGKSRAALLPFVLAKSLEGTVVPPQVENGNTASDRTFRDALRTRLSDVFSAWTDKRFPEELKRYLESANIGSSSENSHKERLHFELNHDVTIRCPNERPANLEFSLPGNIWDRAIDDSQDQVTIYSRASIGDNANRSWHRLKAELGLPSGQAILLPAERGALASAFGFLTDVSIRNASSRGTQLLSAQLGEFLSTLLTSASLHAAGKGEPLSPQQAVAILEQEIMRGRVTSAGSPSLPFPLVYSNIFEEVADRFTIELSQASSSIAEVGPLAMILKSHVKPGDLVVIDEPESNLHPENQRNIARAMVQLAAAGVTVLATTHSSTIIHQVSNLTRAHELSDESRRRLGWGEGDTVSHESVGVYLFKPGELGANISEIAFDEDYGYPEEEFYEVAERMIDETYRIDTVEALAG